jgi:hypothetical protein
MGCGHSFDFVADLFYRRPHGRRRTGHTRESCGNCLVAIGVYDFKSGSAQQN